MHSCDGVCVSIQNIYIQAGRASVAAKKRMRHEMELPEAGEVQRRAAPEQVAKAATFMARVRTSLRDRQAAGEKLIAEEERIVEQSDQPLVVKAKAMPVTQKKQLQVKAKAMPKTTKRPVNKIKLPDEKLDEKIDDIQEVETIGAYEDENELPPEMTLEEWEFSPIRYDDESPPPAWYEGDGEDDEEPPPPWDEATGEEAKTTLELLNTGIRSPREVLRQADAEEEKSAEELLEMEKEHWIVQKSLKKNELLLELAKLKYGME